MRILLTNFQFLGMKIEYFIIYELQNNLKIFEILVNFVNILERLILIKKSWIFNITQLILLQLLRNNEGFGSLPGGGGNFLVFIYTYPYIHAYYTYNNNITLLFYIIALLSTVHNV